MLRSVDANFPSVRVNLLKKVKCSGRWQFFPAVSEPNGRLKDKVRIGDRVEVHPEGVYFIEWREAGRRFRKAIPNRANVVVAARLKSLELELRRSGTALEVPSRPDRLRGPVPAFQPPLGQTIGSVQEQANPALPIAHAIYAAFGAFLQEALRTTMRMQAPPSEENGRMMPFAFLPDTQALCAPGAMPVQIDEQKPDENKDAPESTTEAQPTIAESIDAFLKNIEPPQREPKTYKKYRFTLYSFRDTCKKSKLHEIDRDDCLAFIRHLYSVGNEARTVHNLVCIVQQWLRSNGIVNLLHGRDKPSFVMNMREMYHPEELEALFRACDQDEKMRYLFFLLTGERDQEVRHTTWSDIDFHRKCVRVTEKKQLGFKPKDKEEREIPVPASLLDALNEYRMHRSDRNCHDLVFPTTQGRPDKNFESKLKMIAYRAGLNCGHCVSRHGNKCSEGPYCSKWFLHKFRHTFATSCLEAGVSIRTLQEWLGHSDLASTMVYLKYVGRQGMHEIINKSAMAGLAASALQSPAGPGSESNITPN